MRQITLSMLMFLPWTVQAGVIVQQEWESMPANNGNPWQYSAVRPDVACSPIGGASPSGGCVLRMTYDAGSYSSSVSGGIINYVFSGNYTEIYAGSWVKFVPLSGTYSWNSIGNKIFYSHLPNLSTVGFRPYTTIRAGAQGYNITYDNGIGGNTAIDPNHSRSCNVTTANFSQNTWYWVEWHVALNTVGQANGIMDVWVNDVQCMHYTDLAIIDTNQTYNGGTFDLSPEWGGGGGTISQQQYVYYDHTVLSTTRIGMPGGAPQTGDTQAPSAPAGLSAQAASSSQINLSWSAATDNIGVAGYRIFRGGSQIATAAGTTYSDTGLTASTAYTYTVAAYDAAGNVSAQSAAASAMTLPGSSSVAFPLVLEAENMPTKTVGAAILDGWNVWSDGYVEQTVNFPSAGTYTFDVSAGGQIAVGIWPIMELRIDGVSQGSKSVTGDAFAPYRFTVAMTAGSHRVAVAFTNDYYAPPEDRDLHVDKVTIGAPPSAEPVSCDANNDGSTNVVDVQLAVNQALGASACASDINKDGMCNVVDVQRVVNAALGGACVTGS